MHTAAAREHVTLGIPHLRNLWSRIVAPEAHDGDDSSRRFDKTVIYGLGLGLGETYEFLYGGAPSFEAFERWILGVNGGTLDARTVARINAAVAGEPVEPLDDATPVLDPGELAFFDEHGYVVLRGAVSPAAARAAEDAIWAHLRMDRDDPSTWYSRSRGHGIWVPLRRHPALDANRFAPRIANAFAQLWQRRDLWPTYDQCGFNPPERGGWRFPGPHLHWDVSLVPPVAFGLSGILYLVDVAPDQGAFTCVPGFHRRIDAWLRALPRDADPRREDLSRLETISVGARAGDLVIWHQALPHGASPNRATRPRITQYVAMNPATWEENPNWR